MSLGWKYHRQMKLINDVRDKDTLKAMTISFHVSIYDFSADCNAKQKSRVNCLFLIIYSRSI